jgi:hypothetical protein
MVSAIRGGIKQLECSNAGLIRNAHRLMTAPESFPSVAELFRFKPER